MSYKTDRLVELFPDAYAARDKESLLYKLLDAFGAELMAADEQIKRLLKSHWVRYAEGDALDRLGAVYGVTRRALSSEDEAAEPEPEPDEDFRRRLQSIVPMFTGGGTRRAVVGAVRSALGLPFDLDQLNLPPKFKGLRDDLEALITLTEFSPKGDRTLGAVVKPPPGGAFSELSLRVEAPSAGQGDARVEWTFDKGAGRRLSLELVGAARGVRSLDELIVAEGQTLVLTAEDGGRLRAFVGMTDVSHFFVNLDGTTPALLPPVPAQPSEWKFRARSGAYGDNKKTFGRFDEDAFDLPLFRVTLARLRLEPLTFDVQVPYFLKEAVAALMKRHEYPEPGTPARLFVFRGVPREHIQEVVDQTRAAGVRGNVHFSLTFLEDHAAVDDDPGRACGDRGRIAGLCARADFKHAEAHATADALLVANVSQLKESQGMDESLTLAGVFDISTFEGPFGFM